MRDPKMKWWMRTLAGGVSAAALMAAGALAQDAPVEEIEEESQEVEDDDTITVTGSRLRRDEFSSPAPLTVIDVGDEALSGVLSAAEILQDNPVTSGISVDSTFSGFIGEGGIGTETINLRGLGSNRTLVLLNGRRLPPIGTRGDVSAADAALIPSALLDRVEVLTDGASSIYGADAVAGVVNFIVRDDFDGIEVDLQAEFPDAGGREETRASVGWGTANDRGSLVVGAEYYTNEPLYQADRGFSDCTRDILVDPDTGERTDTGDDDCVGSFNRIAAFTPFGFVSWYDPEQFSSNIGVRGFNDPDLPLLDLDGNTILGADGEPVLAAFDFTSRSPEFATLLSETERLTTYAAGEFDWGGPLNATLYGEIFNGNRTSRASSGLRQTALNSQGIIPVLDATGFFIDDYVDNPQNPFSSSAAQAPVFISDLDNLSETKLEFQKFTGGIRGDVPDSDWRFDAFASYSKSDGTYGGRFYSAQRLQNALDIVQLADGTIDCRANTPIGNLSDPFFTIPPACVPFNPWDDEVFRTGELPDDVKDYVEVEAFGRTTFEQLTVSAGVDGALFTLPAGDVNAFVGLEYRRDELDDQPSALEVQGDLYGVTAAGATTGEDSIAELFGEAEFPLLSGARFAEEMTLNLSGRYTNYDSYGDGTTYRVGFNWLIVPQLRFRTTYGTSFRAPSLYELNLNQQTSFTSALADPCVNLADEDDPDAFVVANCAAEGLAQDLGADGAPSVQIVSGGNPDLEAETSTAFTAGFVYQPNFIDLSLALTYSEIEIEDQVATLSAGSILNSCYTSENFPDEPFCELIGAGGPRRDDNGFITFVQSNFVNFAVQEFAGLDLNARYEHDFDFGELVIDTQWAYKLRQAEGLSADDIDEFAGDIGTPQLEGTLQGELFFGDWSVATDIDYIGQQEDSIQPAGGNAPTLVDVVDPFVVVDLSTAYTRDTYQLRVGVANVFDEEPPLVSRNIGAARQGNVPLGAGYTSAIIGRSVFVGVTKQF